MKKSCFVDISHSVIVSGGGESVIKVVIVVCLLAACFFNLGLYHTQLGARELWGNAAFILVRSVKYLLLNGRIEEKWK